MVKEKVINEKMKIHDVLITCLDDEKNEGSCKSEIKTENSWSMPEMVGYYNNTPLQVSLTLYSATDDISVKKLVCSPDLPLPSFPQQIQSSSEIETGSPANHKMLSSPKASYQLDQRHIKGEVGDPYRCNICSKTFAVPARLTRHYRTHTGEKPFRCEFCDKRFSVKENLSVHTRIHTKERPYKCDVCSRAFEHSGKLHRHMRIHTGERPHKCTVCAKTFIQSGQLVIHMRTHTGEKPYVCPECKKGFTCSKQLKVHSRTHTGEKPYACEMCGKAFGYNHVLKLHQVSHYGSKVYKCKLCKETFTSKKFMESHIKTHAENVSCGFQSSNLPPSPPASNPSSESSVSDKSESSKGPTEVEVDPLEGTRSHFLYSPKRYASTSTVLTAAPSVDQTDFYSTNKELLFTLMNSQKALRNSSSYLTAASAVSASLTAGDDIRKRVEAALILEDINYSEEDQTLTATDSNPDSPESSISHRTTPDPELSLPPRKRSRMIQKSMESNIDLSPIRYSVIQYAGGAS